MSCPDLPVVRPPLDVLEWLELQLTGALPNDLPVPVPLPEQLPASGSANLLLEDSEGRPFATLQIQQMSSTPAGTVQATGALTPQREPVFGPLRHLRQTPARVREHLAGRVCLAVLTRDPLTSAAVQELAQRATSEQAYVLLFALVGAGQQSASTLGLAPHHLQRCLTLAAHQLAAGGVPSSLALPLALPYESDPQVRHPQQEQIARAFGATELIATPPLPPELADLLDAGKPLPIGQFSPATAAVLAIARPPTTQRGLCIMLTGLSGSGKSTIARGVAQALLEAGRAQVSLLDGDQVRALLSAGLGFTRADRELNVTRIGFVAAEITRHGGVAIAAPIAPYATSRAAARELVEHAGGAFVLVHVATGLAECERRDLKGLYARARSGQLPHFTGISDPYEPPEDADLTLDTTNQTPDQSVEMVMDYLRHHGWLPQSTTTYPDQEEG